MSELPKFDDEIRCNHWMEEFLRGEMRGIARKLRNLPAGLSARDQTALIYLAITELPAQILVSVAPLLGSTSAVQLANVIREAVDAALKDVAS